MSSLSNHAVKALQRGTRRRPGLAPMINTTNNHPGSRALLFSTKAPDHLPGFSAIPHITLQNTKAPDCQRLEVHGRASNETWEIEHRGRGALEQAKRRMEHWRQEARELREQVKREIKQWRQEARDRHREMAHWRLQQVEDRLGTGEHTLNYWENYRRTYLDHQPLTEDEESCLRWVRDNESLWTTAFAEEKVQLTSIGISIADTYPVGNCP